MDKKIKNIYYDGTHKKISKPSSSLLHKQYVVHGMSVFGNDDYEGFE